ncbi:MAG: extracellular solute-binding protein [Treponema sp.]|nr:extracellular solute-binding protein [Treponema sp.]
MRIINVLIVLSAFFYISCSDDKAAQIWTDRGEFALYAEYFNNAQNQYKVSVRFVESPAAELLSSSGMGKKDVPDIVAASWLKNSSTGSYFKSLEGLFGANKLSRSIFYPRLLAIGRIDRNQYLLPVSFNIPALIFSRGRDQELSNQFTIDFDEIKALSKNFNIISRGVYTRMGFSPLWDDDFLFASSFLSGTSFREANPLAWDSSALERSMAFINNWTNEINTSTQAEDDFTFKYFFEPPEKLIQSGRILFHYMESSKLFLLSEESKNALDFRWVMEQDRIPLTEDSVYMGIPKKAKSQKAARAFIQWFFRIENQRRLLEYSRTNRINENIFGICGGFSALTSVTEQIYPLFYPELLGRMPPSEYYTLPNVLPANWVVIKERVILPYLHDRARKERAEDTYPLERRLSDWMRMNR